MSILERLNPLRIVRTVDSVPQLRSLNEKLRQDQKEMTRQLKEAGARLDGVYVCVHHPTEGAAPYRLECDCRKPKPGMLHRAARELGLDLAASTVIGDKASDLETGRAVGAAAVLVLTGYGAGDWEYRRDTFRVPPDHVAEDLLDAVEWVLAHRLAARDGGSAVAAG